VDFLIDFHSDSWIEDGKEAVHSYQVENQLFQQVEEVGEVDVRFG